MTPKALGSAHAFTRVAHPLANLLHRAQPLAKLVRLHFELVIHFGHLLLHHATDLAVQGGLRQRQVSLGLAAIALHRRARLARDLEHGHVLTQGVDEQQADMGFINGMRPHHAGALSMSKEYLADKNSSNIKLKALAGGIIKNQTFEIESALNHQTAAAFC